MFKKIGTKLIVFFLLVGIIPLVIVSLISIFITSGQLSTEAENKLLAVRDLKKAMIETYLADFNNMIEGLPQNKNILDLTNELSDYFAEMKVGEREKFPINTTKFESIYDKYDEYLNELKDKYNFYDIFVIGKTSGHVAFTLSREADLGANLKYGEYRETHLAKLWEDVLKTKQLSFKDFQPYEPSGGDAASFIGVPIIQNGDISAILAIQISLQDINSIMQNRTGMGRTGETYLIGADYLPRSDLLFDDTDNTVIDAFKTPEDYRIKTPTSEKAIQGKSGVEIINDYAGKPVYSAYAPIEDANLNWAVLAEIDVAEMNNPIVVMVITVAIVAVVIAVIIFIISFVLSKSISDPLKRATELIKDMSEGKLKDEKLKVKSKDEVGTLAQSLNVMLDFLVERNRLMGNIAEGDLTVKVKLASDEDEVGISLRDMVGSLNEIVAQINYAVEQIKIGSDQISESTQSLSTGSSEQASSIEEITATAQAIASQAQRNVDNAQKTDDIATSTKDNAEQGNSQMRELVVAMDKINKSSNDIKNIIKLIDDIAFQTNLLALNADIEAARVGKYGKGFAVVANSVRNLASKSGKAVKETAEMIDDALKNIAKGNELVDVTAGQLQEITKISTELKNIVREVSQASQEQAAGIEEMNTGLNQIEEVVQSNSANAEENAAASEELSAQAKRLKEMVSRFNVDESRSKLALESAREQDEAHSKWKMIGSSSSKGGGKDDDGKKKTQNDKDENKQTKDVKPY
jgi:methyl-accepting chemotaxis protein